MVSGSFLRKSPISPQETRVNFWHPYRPMTTLDCKFCRKEMVYVPLTVSHPGFGSTTFHAHFCFDCNYEYAPIGGMRNHHLYRKIGDRMYRWSYDEATGATRIWYIGTPGVPGESPNKDLELLKSFNEPIPPVTPENVEDKLKLVLVFL
jgi:hypothetical protein